MCGEDAPRRETTHETMQHNLPTIPDTNRYGSQVTTYRLLCDGEPSGMLIRSQWASGSSPVEYATDEEPDEWLSTQYVAGNVRHSPQRAAALLGEEEWADGDWTAERVQ